MPVSITKSKIRSRNIVDGTIVAADLASDAVETAKIKDANVTTAKILDDNVTADKLANSLIKGSFSAMAFGTWLEDGDGVQTNGGGMIGDVTTTEASSPYAVVYDEGTIAYAELSSSSNLTGWTNNYQLTSDHDAPEQVNDAVYFGNSLPFCELGVDLGAAVGTYGGDAFAWEYWNGSAWSALTLAYDNTDTTAQDGKRSFQQAGAISFVPPSDWATTTVNSQSAYWVRCRVTAAQVTQTPQNSAEHAIIAPADGIEAPFTGTITDIRAMDAAGTLHTTTDVKWILMNFTTGAHSGELTWAQDKRCDSWSSLSLAITAGDTLGVLVTQDDGTNDVSNVGLEMIVTRS